MSDPRIGNYEFDVEVDRKAKQRLAEMGVNKPEDLGPGRGADLAQVADQLGHVDADVSPLIAEKVMRDREMRKMAGDDEQPTATPSTGESAPVAEPSDFEKRLKAAEAEAADWKHKYGERENQLGTERKRTADRLAQLERGNGTQSASQPTVYQGQPVNYDPRILGDRDPSQPLTAGETAALLQQMSSAFGQQLNVRDRELMEVTRSIQGYDLTPGEEADLLGTHTWLGTLDRPSQMSAMRDLIGPARDKLKQPSGAANPQFTPNTNQTEMLRQRHLASTTFIEPSSPGSSQENQAASTHDYELGKKAARLKDLLATPGGSTSGEAERLMNELSGRR